MPTIFGVIDLEEAQLEWTLQKFGEVILYEGATEFLNMHNMDLEKLLAIFVEQETERFKETYRLPGNGRMQRRGEYARAGARRVQGSWTVEYPILDFSDEVVLTRIEAGYMTVAEFQLHVEGVTIADINTHRFEILRRLFNNTADTFDDVINGSLTIQPLANNDATLYRPVLGADDPATEDHYLASGYASGSISDTNNPFPVVRQELEHHFGTPTGFGNVMAFINPNQVAVVEDLTDFVAVEDIGINYGDDTDLAEMLGVQIPGRLIGRCNGVWISEWYHMPADYLLATDIDMPGPLKRRVDPAATGLPRGLTMIPDNDRHPIQNSIWSNRWGYGAGNRLNGVVMHFTAGAFAVPAAFA